MWLLKREYQEHDWVKDGSTLSVQYAFVTTTAIGPGKYTKDHRSGEHEVQYKMYGRAIVAVLFVVTASIITAAESDFFTWAETNARFDAKAVDEQVVASFPFTNTSDGPVTITAIEPSCGCMAAVAEEDEAEEARGQRSEIRGEEGNPHQENATGRMPVPPSLPRTYQPGESGVIRATLPIGSETGRRAYTITVTTTPTPKTGEPETQAEPQVHTLRFSVNFPQVLRIHPRMLYWTHDDHPTLKTMTLTVKHDQPVKITKVTDPTDSLNLTLETLEPGRKYTLTAAVRRETSPCRPTPAERTPPAT